MLPKNLSPAELILNPNGSVYHLSLLPDEISTKIITVGDPERVQLISKKFDKIDTIKESREFLTHTGFYKGKRITVISTGIGTDNIDIVINELDALVNIDLNKRQIKDNHTALEFYRVGTSGTIQGDIKLGSILISKTAIGFDGLLPFYPLKDSQNNFTKHLLTELNQENLFCFQINASQSLTNKFDASNVIFGNTLTMPGFYAPQGRALRFQHPIPNFIERLAHFSHNNERLTNIEMETSGIYGLAKLLGHKAVSVNAILANRINGVFAEKPLEAVEKAIDITLNTIID